MGEIKSVKVDNWGVFFLQKLQNFFNKTDYCDLTLQFRDNSQLKVHRLVLSACTDYFNVLEQTCEVIDDALIMPNELQADVVVPIVNFMYTGTLEFELKMYGKLLRTAKEMNMTVLLKLLEAHRRTMENVNRAQRPPSPKAIRRRVPVGMQTVPTNSQFQNQTQQARRITMDAGGVNVVQRRVVQTKGTGTNASPTMQVYRQQIGSTSVVRTSTLKGNQQTHAYIKNEPEEYETITATHPTSPFEQLRKGYNNNKRPAVTTFSSPPTKKPNLEDVKEFAEQQRMRKQIAAEYGDDQEFEGMMDDDIHNDDDDDDAAVGGPVHSSSTISNAGPTEGTRNTSITFKQESDGQPPTIIVKDSSGSKLNHAKIISEVLRQYPHLAKGNKNIKLKIMPNASGQTQRIIVKKEQEQQQIQQPQQNIPKVTVQQKTILPTQLLSSQVTVRAGDRVISQGQQVVAQKPTLPATQKLATPQPNIVVDNSQQKRRIDSKTMHALIALGAENVQGPWLCLRCGVNGRPISIPSYRGFRRHLINTHKETIDPALCEHCGWRSRTNRELHFHMQTEHKIKTTLYTFPECLLCVELFLDTNALNQHMLDSHPSANKQQCIYCNKIFVKEMQLFTHMKLYHKHQALEDGIIDASDDELVGTNDEDGNECEQMDTDSEREMTKSSSSERKDAKVKILSDISLPMASSIIKMDSTNTKESLDVNLIDSQTKFVTADGNEMILTEEQRKEIMSQLNHTDHNNGGVVMVLQEAIFPSDEAIGTETAVSAEDTTSGRGEIASEEELDDSQIYAELASAQNAESHEKAEKVNLQSDARDHPLDNLEWAENLISEHDLADNRSNAPNKKDDEDKAKKDDISQKLKELTGDWSEDENEEEDNNDDLDKTEKSDVEPNGESINACEEKSTADQTEELSKTQEETIVSADEQSPCSKTNVNAEDQEETVVEKDTVHEIKNETENPEQDELDLAMQNLHEGGEDIKVEKNLSAERLPSLDEDVKMEVDEVKTEVEKTESTLDEPSGSNVEQNATTNATTTITPGTTVIDATNEIVDHSTTLLDELMATTTTADANLDAQKAEAIDDFEDAELNDVEEFTSLEKIEEPPTNIIAKEAKISSEVETKSHEEMKISEKDIISSVGGESEMSVPVAKSISSDWEDIEDDDDDDMVGVSGNDDAV